MGKKSSCCEKDGVRRGAWSADEDAKLVQYINQHGHGSWRNLPRQAGLLRCGKSCRLRWINYLRPDIKRGQFTLEEETSIIQLHGLLGNKWAAIASHLPGRTDNEVKNFWNTRLKKRLSSATDTESHNHQSRSCYRPIKTESSTTRHIAQWESVRVEAEARLSTELSLAGKTDHDSDIFLRLWNSEVGKSFRVISTTMEGGEASASVVSQTYPPTKLDSGSFFTVQARAATSSMEITSQDQEDDIYRPNVEMMAGSDSMSSNDQFPDSSDTSALKLLLDNFPGDNMEFVHDHQTENHVPNFLDLQCDSNHLSDSSLVGTP